MALVDAAIPCGPTCLAEAGTPPAGDADSPTRNDAGNALEHRAATTASGTRTRTTRTLTVAAVAHPVTTANAARLTRTVPILICTAESCQVASDSDGIQNQDEISIDCGDACGVPYTSIEAALVRRFRFNGTGTAVVNSEGGLLGALRGTPRGTPLVGNGTASPSGGSSDQYVDLPNGTLSSLTNATLAFWSTWQKDDDWQRISDFGQSTSPEGVQNAARSSLFLSPKVVAGSVFIVFRYCSDKGPTGDSRVDGCEFEASSSEPFPIATRVHVAAAFDDTNNAMRLLLTGVQVASSSNGGQLSEIGDVNNWLECSQYRGDPKLNAVLPEFRIYDKPLSLAEINFNTNVGPDPTYLN